MQSVFEHFKTITAIPRCSLDAAQMKDHIVAFAKECGFKTSVDSVGNVLCLKGEPTLCLQAHYDMVCIGQTESIELIKEENILRAAHSTLGADNGMGMAIMFAMMQTQSDLECLFTADEEVGLIGASHFRLPLHSKYLLNLDSEEEGKICIGCAGGVDIIASKALHVSIFEEGMELYEVNADGFLGGHSGVDIDKHIPSAIKVLARELLMHPCKIVHFEGGDRRNAIAKSARAIVASHKPLKLFDTRLHVKKINDTQYEGFFEESPVIIKALCGFAQGIRDWDRELDIPLISINLGLVRICDKTVRFDCAARAMDDENLAILSDETQAFFTALGFDVVQESWHGAWKPNIGKFAQTVHTIMQENYPEVRFQAIHAGLECGELICHQTKKIEAISIGPTIRYPHSLREECDMDSVERMQEIVAKIIKEVQHGTH